MDLSVFGIESTTMTVTAALTAVTLVAGALIIAFLVGPRSYTIKKGEPYECGIPTRGDSMAQFHVGYYLFAILFLMFDVETVFLFPWATICRSELGSGALLAVGTFLVILVLGLAYAWKKGALRWK
ncbi:MAG: NADH-quinone oxidoreductase subunit A [Muribaculaceae bacterium]|nr:NADH-quinone oxidoreductase subunit A [Muribaculaceae bacterium]